MKASRLACAALLASANAGARPPQGKHNAISYEPIALASAGISAQYERWLMPDWSAVAGASYRSAAREDFSSRTPGLHLAARYWLSNEEPLANEHGMVGPYFELAVESARTSLTNERTDRFVGAAWNVQESARFGYRFVVFGFQELSAGGGFDIIHELDESGRLAPNTRYSVGLTLSIGWLFDLPRD